MFQVAFHVDICKTCTVGKKVTFFLHGQLDLQARELRASMHIPIFVYEEFDADFKTLRKVAINVNKK